MQKILILSLIITILSSCSLGKIGGENTNTGSIISSNEEKRELTDEEKQIKEAEEKKDKIETLRKRLAFRGLIMQGDISLQNQDYTSALVKYLQIHKEIPKDHSTTEKIGDIYFNLKKFKQAYLYYSKIKDYDKLNNNRVAITLISSMNLTEENIKYLNNELKTLNLNEDELFYYTNSLTCIKDFSLCKQHFQDYFKEKEEIKKDENTGSGKIVEIENFKELYNIKTALENYKNFQVDDLSYKGALVSGAFFENGLYPIAIQTSKILLEDRKDYKPLLKLIAKSYYELGDYINAKLNLLEYNKLLQKDDSEASYFLGVVYEKLHEYVLSTIHFKKALNTGFEDTLDVNKRILFNYYELGEIDKLLESFKIIIKENKNKINEDDYNLAIYYHIVNDKLDDAKKITNEALEKYPKSEIFNGYYGWILMDEINSKKEKLIKEGKEITEQKDEYKKAEEFIDKGLELNPKSPMLNLVKGKLEISKNDKQKAFIFFKKTVSLDNDGDFGKIAKQELKNIK